MDQLLAILAIFLFSVLVIILALLCFNRLWVRRLGVQIPDKRTEGLHIHQQTVRMKTTSFALFWDTYTQILDKLSRSYWSSNCGVDGYIYMSFQRHLMRQTFYFFIIAVLVCIPANVSFSSVSDNWYEKMMLNNKELNYFTAWMHVILVFVFSLISLITMHNLRIDVRNAYFDYYVRRSLQNDVEFLKQRTLHVQGLLPQDKRGNRMVTQVNHYLKQFGGAVLGVVVIPDYQNLFQLELQMRDLKDYHQLVDVHPDGPRCCVPKMYYDSRVYEREMEKLDNKMQEEIKKPFLASGHAFISVDSLNSFQMCLRNYDLNARSAIGLCWNLLKDKVTRRKSEYNRKISTFQRFQDEYDSDQPDPANQTSILMSQCFEPMDQNWANMSGTRGVFLFRRIWIFIGTFLVLVFLTTPTAIFLSFKTLSQEYLPEQQRSWINDSEIGGYLRAYTPPILILIINNILVNLIDYSSQLERHNTYSKTQYSVFNKATPYLILNMLIIPAITLATAKSLYKIVSEKNWEFTRVLGDLYTPDSGVFFVTLLIQNATITGTLYLTRIFQIISHYCSPWLSHYRRQMLNDREPWRKSDGDIYPFGYYYAQMVTTFAIVIMFSTTIPLVTVSGIFFFLVRHFVDGYNLLTVHKKEIESSQGLVTRVLFALHCCVLLYQLAMFGFFMIHGRYYESIAVGVIGFLTFIFMCLELNRKLVDFRRVEAAQLARRAQKEEGGVYDVFSGEVKAVGPAPFSTGRNQRAASIAHSRRNPKVTTVPGRVPEEGNESSGRDQSLNASFMQNEVSMKRSSTVRVPGLGFVAPEGGLDLDNQGQRIFQDKILWDWMSIYKHPLSVLQREQAPFDKNVEGKPSERPVPLQALSDQLEANHDKPQLDELRSL